MSLARNLLEDDTEVYTSNQNSKNIAKLSLLSN